MPLKIVNGHGPRCSLEIVVPTGQCKDGVNLKVIDWLRGRGYRIWKLTKWEQWEQFPQNSVSFKPALFPSGIIFVQCPPSRQHLDTKAEEQRQSTGSIFDFIWRRRQSPSKDRALWVIGHRPVLLRSKAGSAAPPWAPRVCLRGSFQVYTWQDWSRKTLKILTLWRFKTFLF